ncbi:MAG TPA: peptidyl-prolyl cis-trans isomerase, partial [Gammaproteobacteria bacterium]
MYKSFALIAAAGLTLVVTGCGSTEIGRPMQPAGETVATVNGVGLTAAELELNTMARQQMRQAISTEDSLKEIINIELIRQAAVNQKLHEDPKVMAEINRQSTGILVSAYVRKLMEDNPVNDEKIQQTYDKYVGGLPKKEYKAKHILSATKDEAVANIAALKAGTKFGKLAKEKSLDKSSADGDLDWANPNSYVPEFAAALQALEPGSYSQEPVQTQFGWHVILLEEVRDAKLPAMDEIRPQLQRLAFNNIVEAKIEELRNAAKIDIKETKSKAE